MLVCYPLRVGDSLPARIDRALRRARFGIVTVAGTYALSIAVGMAMVHAGNHFARDYANRLVSQAHSTSPILRALHEDKPLKAAALDASANLLAGVASTLAGYWAPGGYLAAISRGWVGGIVSVDSRGRSRLADRSEAEYYLITLVLQLIPYSLVGGAGVNLGIARVRPVGDYAGPKWLLVPREAWRDAGRIYLPAIPLFAIASAFEFLMR